MHIVCILFVYGLRMGPCESTVKEPAFYDQYAVSMPDPGVSSEERFVLIGMDAIGRIVVVVYTYRGSSIRIISARAATRSERKSYEKGIRL